MLGKPDYEGTLSRLSEDAFSILIVHEPDAALEIGGYPVNLQLSGHTHGRSSSRFLLSLRLLTENVYRRHVYAA